MVNLCSGELPFGSRVQGRPGIDLGIDTSGFFGCLAQLPLRQLLHARLQSGPLDDGFSGCIFRPRQLGEAMDEMREGAARNPRGTMLAGSLHLAGSRQPRLCT